MGTTTKGYPYPEPTDPVANTDLAIKALAQQLDLVGFKALHVGDGTVNLSAAAVGNVGVTFPVGRFTAAPKVVATVENGSSVYFVTVSGVTTAGCTLTVRHYTTTATTAAVKVNFVAVQLT